MKFNVLLISLFIIFVGCETNETSRTAINEPIPFEFTEDLLEPTEGTDIGNGGDLMQCYRNLPKFPFDYDNGWYLLDYAEMDNAKVVFLSSISLSEQIKKVHELLQQAAPELVDSFEQYIRTVPFLDSIDITENVGATKRIWTGVDQNEVLNDEDPAFIPNNCKNPKDKNILFHQVVVRNKFSDSNGNITKITYSYDPALLAKLENKPLQLSMLIVHEWLWDYFDADQSKRLRIANRILHSDLKMPIAFVRRALKLDSVVVGTAKN